MALGDSPDVGLAHLPVSTHGVSHKGEKIAYLGYLLGDFPSIHPSYLISGCQSLHPV